MVHSRFRRKGCADQAGGAAMTVDELYSRAFDVPRAPRSAEYRQGVLAALRYRIKHARIEHRYPTGTAAADAFFAGLDEGHRLWREAQ